MRERIGYVVKCAAYNQPLMGVDWTRSENQRWLDVADQIMATVADAVIEARRKERQRARDIVLAHAKGCTSIDPLCLRVIADQITCPAVGETLVVTPSGSCDCSEPNGHAKDCAIWRR